MKKTLIFTSGLFLFTVMLSSCTTAYIPTDINAPAFNDDNQLKAGLSYGNSGSNFQIGYSFLKNFAVISDISYLNLKGNESQFQRQFGFGLGYFSRFQKSKSVYYEVFAGFSTAATNSSYKESAFALGPDFENARYNRFYIQQDISFQHEFIDVIFAVRLNYFNFTGYERYNVPAPVLPRAVGIEPAVKLRMGSEYLKVKLQFGLSFIETYTKDKFKYDKSFIHVGLEFNF